MTLTKGWRQNRNDNDGPDVSWLHQAPRRKIDPFQFRINLGAKSVSLQSLCQPRQSVFAADRRATVLNLESLLKDQLSGSEFFDENYSTVGMETLIDRAFRHLAGFAFVCLGNLCPSRLDRWQVIFNLFQNCNYCEWLGHSEPILIYESA